MLVPRRLLTAPIVLAPKLLFPRDLDREAVGQRVHNGNADAVQAASGLVGVAAKLAARMQHGEDNLQRRFFGKPRVRIDRYAAAIIADGKRMVRAQLDLNARGEAGDGLVHSIVEDLGGEMVKRALIGAADIHAGPAAHRLQPFENLDIFGRIARGLGAGAGEEIDPVGGGFLIGARRLPRRRRL